MFHLNFGYLAFTFHPLCVCERQIERERERENEKKRNITQPCVAQKRRLLSFLTPLSISHFLLTDRGTAEREHVWCENPTQSHKSAFMRWDALIDTYTPTCAHTHTHFFTHVFIQTHTHIHTDTDTDTRTHEESSHFPNINTGGIQLYLKKEVNSPVLYLNHTCTIPHHTSPHLYYTSPHLFNHTCTIPHHTSTIPHHTSPHLFNHTCPIPHHTCTTIPHHTSTTPV